MYVIMNNLLENSLFFVLGDCGNWVIKVNLGLKWIPLDVRLPARYTDLVHIVTITTSKILMHPLDAMPRPFGP